MISNNNGADLGKRLADLANSRDNSGPPLMPPPEDNSPADGYARRIARLLNVGANDLKVTDDLKMISFDAGNTELANRLNDLLKGASSEDFMKVDAQRIVFTVDKLPGDNGPLVTLENKKAEDLEFKTALDAAMPALRSENDAPKPASPVALMPGITGDEPSTSGEEKIYQDAAARLTAVFGKEVRVSEVRDFWGVPDFEIAVGDKGKADKIIDALVAARTKAGLQKEDMPLGNHDGTITIFAGDILDYQEREFKGVKEETFKKLEDTKTDFKTAFTIPDAPKEPSKADDKPTVPPAKPDPIQDARSRLEDVMGIGGRYKMDQSNAEGKKFIYYDLSQGDLKLSAQTVTTLTGAWNNAIGSPVFQPALNDRNETTAIIAVAADDLTAENIAKLSSHKEELRTLLQQAKDGKLPPLPPQTQQQPPATPGAPIAGAAPGTTPPPNDPGMFTTGGMLGAAGAAVLGYLGLSGLTGGFSSITSTIMTVLAVAAAAVAGLFAGKFVETSFFKPQPGPDATPAADAVTVKAQPQKSTSVDSTLTVTQANKDYTLTGTLDSNTHKFNVVSIKDASAKSLKFNQSEVLQLNLNDQADDKDPAVQARLKEIIKDSQNAEKATTVGLTPAASSALSGLGMKLPGFTDYNPGDHARHGLNGTVTQPTEKFGLGA